MPRDHRSTLPGMLDREGPLPAAFASHGEAMHSGRLYVAPPDRHLLIAEDRIFLGTGPLENNVRPAIDPLFQSAALYRGPRSIGVVLTGTLDDGSAGLRAIKRCGGIAVVQDPADAEHAEMPRNAIGVAGPDHVLPLGAIPALLARLVATPAGRRRLVPKDIRHDVGVAARGACDLTADDVLGGRRRRSNP